MSEQTLQVTLSDGRNLDVRVSGPDDGLALVYHHGTPSSLVDDGFDRPAQEHGLRLICASRAGYGGSSPNHGRSVVDVVTDTREVLEHLGIDRCLVAGWSGGGPHALACAARLPGVLGALVIAGVAPFEAGGLDFLAGMGQDNIDEFGASIESPEVLRAYLSNARDELADLTVESLIASMDSLLPEVDRVVLTEEFGANMVASVVEGLRLGYEGWFEDDLAFVAPWGFDLDEISIPTAIWQGSEDLMVPFAHGEWLASHVPDTSAHLLEGEGHLSVGIGAMDQMVEELLSFAAN